MNTNINGLPIRWTGNLIPLAPEMVVAEGTTARDLLKKVIDFENRRFALFEGLSAGDIVFIKSDDELPWIKGVSYLGRHASAPNLYLPTHTTANVPIQLLERALVKKAGSSPIAILPEHNLLVPLSKLLRLNRAVISDWLREHC